MSEVRAEIAGEAVSGLPAPATVQRVELHRLPSPAAMQAALAQLTRIEDMHELRQQIAAWEEVQKRFRVAQDVVIEVATLRLRLERKMGHHLARTVRRGGRGSKSDATTSIRGGSSRGLPLDIDKHRARWYRQLAAVPEQEFEAYLEQRKREGRPPSASGLIRRASGPRSGKVGRAAQEPDALRPVAPGASVLEAIGRLMDVDLVVGDVGGAWPGAQHLPVGPLPGKLSGSVFLAVCKQPGISLPLLASMREQGRIRQVVAWLPPEPGAAWFKQIERTGWFCCFTVDGIVAYCGERSHAFHVVFDGLGAVLRAY